MSKIEFVEEELFFNWDGTQEKSVFDGDLPSAEPDIETFGIKVRLGNAPIVHNLENLLKFAKMELPPNIASLFVRKDIYTVTHAVGALRINGNAKVKEIQYNAEIQGLEDAQTIDLLPSSKFEKVFEYNAGIEGAMKASGQFVASVPDTLKNALTGQTVSLGGDVELELSSDAQFVGRVKCSIQLPITQAIGISSNKCSWIINPEKTPLLGDQLFIQTVAVPKGTSELIYRIKGLVKIDRGFLFKSIEKETSSLLITIKLL